MDNTNDSDNDKNFYSDEYNQRPLEPVPPRLIPAESEVVKQQPRGWMRTIRVCFSSSARQAGRFLTYCMFFTIMFITYDTIMSYTRFGSIRSKQELPDMSTVGNFRFPTVFNGDL